MAYIPGRKKKVVQPLEGEVSPKKGDAERHPGDLDLIKLKSANEDLEAVNHQLRESHIEMILRLAIAAEYKDPDTGSHILRISDYATELGKALSLSPEEADILRYASPMHDIGKIGIPDRILQKPGKLTDEEWEIMKTHTVIGARMFENSKSPVLKATSVIALSHHEKYDGSGYPNGVKGENIPLFGRIVALVDVFDAVVSKRCYKEKMSFEEGFAIIQGLGGTHLDPKLVALFGKIEKKLRKVYEANQTIQEFVENAKNDPINFAG